ncbi:hypothetical protein PAHAL_3G155000, partial [Panicum hallii]
HRKGGLVSSFLPSSPPVLASSLPPLPRTVVWLPLPPSTSTADPAPDGRKYQQSTLSRFIYRPPSIPSPTSPPRRRALSCLFRPVLPPRLQARSRCGVGSGS